METTAPAALSQAPAAPRLSLVLSGGGARAAYQVGVLRYLGLRLPHTHVPVITGVSAGAINTFCLASHTGNLREATGTLTDRWLSLSTSDVFRTATTAMATTAVRWVGALASGGARLAPSVRGLVDTEPLRRFLNNVVDPSCIEENLRNGRLRAVGISATSYHTGQTVTWVQAEDTVEMWERTRRRSLRAKITVDHVMASSAIPLLFPAVQIGDDYFGDGSIRQSNPLAPAVHLGAEKILAISSRYGRTGVEARDPVMHGYPPPAHIIGLLLNSIFLDSLDADSARLTRINHLISRIPEATREKLALRQVGLLVIRPSRDLGMLASGHEARLPRALRFLVRGLGTRGSRSSDFLSYLLFERSYIGELLRLGERDAERQWPRIAEFLGVDETVGAGAPGLMRD
ncbi:MAG: patatin-like phospholipase family protein [Gemmatimonadota bacterium]